MSSVESNKSPTMEAEEQSQPKHKASVKTQEVEVEKEEEVVTEVAVNNNTEKYLDSFPPGYRFCPHDYELIVHYLKKKVLNETLPLSKIREVNLYHHNPDKLTEKYQVVGEREWYFFTPRDRKYRNGNRPNRAAGNGYWKATGADKSVIYNGATVGHRKALVFYEGKPPKGDKTNWIMHEYRVHAPPKRKRGADDMRLDDWVLCRIYKKADKFAKTKPEDEEQEPTGNSSILSDESSPVVMNENNDLVEKNYDYNQIGDSNGLMDSYNSDYLLQPPFQNSFATIPHFTDVSLPKFSTFNGQVQHGFNYGAQPISFRPPVYNSGDRIFRSKYLKEDGWSSKAKGLPEDVWGMGIPDLDSLSQFDFSNSTSYMVDPFLNFDMLATNGPNNPPMPTTD